MPDKQLARQRLVAQGLVTRPYASPLEAVHAFGVMQGQDLPGVLASAALRTQEGTIEPVLEALNRGELVRGYPMRGTVFLAPAQDLRWITELCAGPSLRDAERRRERFRTFSATDIDRVHETFVSTAPVEGLSRDEFAELLRCHSIDPAEGNAYHILFTLLASGRLAYSQWNGKDQQIVDAGRVLGPGLEERFNGDQVAAVAEFASRYFRTHGPATIADFAWWTKLPLRIIRQATAHFPDDIEHLGDETFARAGLRDEVAELGTAVAKPHLLPGFDEYVLGYKDRLFAMDAATHAALVPGNNGVFKKSVVVDATVRGWWTRTGPPNRRRLDLTELTTIPRAAAAGIRRSFRDYPFVAA